MVHFSIGTYVDFVDCDVVPIQGCSLLLCHLIMMQHTTVEVINTHCLHRNLEGGSLKLESSQNHVSKESITCESKQADSDAALESAFFK